MMTKRVCLYKVHSDIADTELGESPLNQRSQLKRLNIYFMKINEWVSHQLHHAMPSKECFLY